MSESAPTRPPLDNRMKRYMRARAARKQVSSGLSMLVRLAYRGRLDPSRHSIIIPESSWSPWRSDTEFQQVAKQIDGFTLVDEMRLYELWQLTGQLADVPGDILEVGVWRGGSGCLMATRSQRLQSDSRVYLCDTFSGVAKAGDADPIYSGGEHADTSRDLVQALANHMGLDNVEILSGIFPEETGESVSERSFKLCHLDVDVYESTLAAANWIWPKLVEGGVIVVDDYGGDQMDGVQRAVTDLIESKGPLCRMFYNLNGHAIVVKVAAAH